MFPDLRGRGPVLLHSVLLGAALTVLGFAAAAVFLYDAEGLLVASAGFVVTLVAALATGIWAGAPSAASAEPPPMRGRWFAAGISVGVAGAFATLWSVSEDVRTGILGRTLALVLLVAAPVYVLGLLLPALLAWAEERESKQREAQEWDEAAGGGWDPLGTVVIGTLAGAALGALLSGLVLVPRLGSGPLLLGMAAVLIIPTLFREDADEVGGERVLFETESPLSAIRVVEIAYPGRRQPERRLYVNDEEESGELVRSGAPTLAYIAAAEQWLARISARGDRYLFLGGGAYTLPRRVAERDPGARITVVELDPDVTRAAYQFFGVRPEHRIVSLHGDARARVDAMVAGGEAQGTFDRIFVDVYDGREALPYSLVTHEAYATLGRLLTPSGCVALNAIGVVAGAGDRRFWSIVRTLADVFPAVALYTHLGRDFPERQNVLLAASPDPGAVFPANAGIFEAWPRDEWPSPHGTTIFHDLGTRVAPAAEVPPREPRGGRAATAS